jgi:hypothetical protein
MAVRSRLPLMVFRPGHLEEPQSPYEVCWRYHLSIRLRPRHLLVLKMILTQMQANDTDSRS